MKDKRKTIRKKHVPKPKGVDINISFNDDTEIPYESYTDEVIETLVNVRAKTVSIKVLRDD